MINKNTLKAVIKETQSYSKSFQKKIKKACENFEPVQDLDVDFDYNAKTIERELNSFVQAVMEAIVDYVGDVSSVIYDTADEEEILDADMWEILEDNSKNIIELDWREYERDVYHIEDSIYKFGYKVAYCPFGSNISYYDIENELYDIL